MRELTREDFGVAPGEPFDLEQANRVYRWASAVPEPVAKMVTEQMAWEHDAAHAQQRLAQVRDDVAKRLAQVTPGLSQLSKRNDPAVDTVVKAAQIVQAWLGEVSKQDRVATPEGERYYGQPIGSIIEADRFGDPKKPRRGSTKRPGITRIQRAFQIDPEMDVAPEEMGHISGKWQRGERAGVQGLDAEQARAFQRAWRQTALQLHNAQQEMGPGVGQARLVWGERTDDQNKGIPVDPSTTPVLINGQDLIAGALTPEAAREVAAGRQLLGVELLSRNDVDPGVGIASRIGIDPGQFVTGRAAAKEAGRSVTGEKTWDLKDVKAPRHTESSARRPNAGKYNAASRAAGAAGDMLTPYNPTAATALKAGAYAGRYGQNVEDMIGPTVERAAFRYRAVEKAPPADLQAALDGLRSRSTAGSRTARDGRTVSPGRQAHLDFTLGWHSASEERQARNAGAKVTMNGRTLPAGSPLRQFLTDRLPDQSLLQLHQQAGRATPSEGVIINRSGDIVTQSVGEGSDWYLPFTARRLGDMAGGFYGRTRLWGGPTPEDISTALANDARGFMVQSRHGTYYVEFADDFRGLRRRNDKTMRMAKDYEDLLDAMRAGKVSPQIPPERMAEIARTAEQLGGLDSGKVRTARERLIAEERRNPQLPTSTKIAAAEAVLARWAASGIQTSGEEYPLEQAKADILTEYGAEQRSRYLAQGFGPEQAQQRAEDDVRGKVDDPIWMVGRNPDLKRMYDRQVEAATKDARRELAATRLNGEGYAKALRALQEIYPYYFASIEYRPGVFKEDAEGSNSPEESDGYYTRPGDTRPADTTIGLFEAPNSSRSGPISGGDRWAKNPERRGSTPKAEQAPTQSTQGGQGGQGAQGGQQDEAPSSRDVRAALMRTRQAFVDPQTGQFYAGLTGKGAVADQIITGNMNDPEFAQNVLKEIRLLERAGDRLTPQMSEALRDLKITLTQQQSAQMRQQARQSGMEPPKAATSDEFTSQVKDLAEQEAVANQEGATSQRVKPAQMDQVVDDTLTDLPKVRVDAYKPQAPRELLQQEYGAILTDLADIVGFDQIKRLPDVQAIGQEATTDELESAARSALQTMATQGGPLMPGASAQQQAEQRDAQAKQNDLIVNLMRARYIASRAETAKPASQVVRNKPKSLSEMEQQAERDARQAAAQRPQPSPEAQQAADESAAQAASAIPIETLMRQARQGQAQSAAATVPEPQTGLPDDIQVRPRPPVADEVEATPAREDWTQRPVDPDDPSAGTVGTAVVNHPAYATLYRRARGITPNRPDMDPEEAAVALFDEFGEDPEVWEGIQRLLSRAAAGQENKVKRKRTQ